MMKKLLIVAISVLVLVVGGLAVFLSTFDINSYKGDLIQLVRQQTGRDFDISGPLKLEVSLRPAIAAEGVRIGNAAWASGSDMATVKRLRARTALLPLLHGQVRIESLQISGAHIELARGPLGTGNWVFANGKSPASSTPAAGTGHALPVPELRSVSIDNTVIRYRPGKGAKTETMDVKHLTANADSSNAPIKFGLSADYNALPIDVKGTVGPLSDFRDNRPYAFKLSGKIGEAALDLNGSIGAPATFSGIKADVSIKADSLATLGKLNGQQWPPLKPVSMAATVAPEKSGVYRLKGLAVTLGHSRITGDASVNLAGSKPRISARIQAPNIDLAELSPPAHNDKRIFSKAPLKLGALASFDGRVDFEIGELQTASMRLDHVKGKAVVANAKLVLDPLHAGIAGGKLNGRVALGALPGKKTGGALLDTRLRVDKLMPGKLPKIAKKHLVNGAATDLDIAIKGRGGSMAAIMGNANGHFVARMGSGTLNSRAANIAGTDLLNMLQLLNPLASHQSETHLQCAVAKFDIRNGIAATQRGIAMQTNELNVLGGGTINLKTEAIDIAAKPQPRQGIGVNLAGLTDFVHLGGTLSNPTPVADAAGVAKTGAKVGLAFATGGLSLLAQGLFDRATSDDDVCAIAMGTKSVHNASQKTATTKNDSVIDKTTSATKNAVEGVGNAVKGAFQSLFGK